VIEPKLSVNKGSCQLIVGIYLQVKKSVIIEKPVTSKVITKLLRVVVPVEIMCSKFTKKKIKKTNKNSAYKIKIK